MSNFYISQLLPALFIIVMLVLRMKTAKRERFSIYVRTDKPVNRTLGKSKKIKETETADV